MLDASFYILTQTLWGAFFYAMTAVRNRAGEKPSPPPPLLQVQPGMAESPGWFLVQAAEFDPEPLTVENLRVRDIYASPRIVGALLEVMAAEKWFDRQGEKYHLTDTGRTLMRERQTGRDHWMGALDPLLESSDIIRLERLLGRMIEACLDCEDPPGNWSLAHSRNRAPAEDAAVSVKLFQYVADINAFRDDAHMAAWRPYGIEGYVWEAFSFVGGGQADSAATLFDQLSYRGYARDDYADALGVLTGRGWLETTGDGSCQITEKGQAVREEAERLTDEYFYAPWRSALNEKERSEVRHLMEQLRDALGRIN